MIFNLVQPYVPKAPENQSRSAIILSTSILGVDSQYSLWYFSSAWNFLQLDGPKLYSDLDFISLAFLVTNPDVPVQLLS